MEDNIVIAASNNTAKLERRIAYLEGGVHAIRIIARRPFVSVELAALIRAECELARLQDDGSAASAAEPRSEELVHRCD